MREREIFRNYFGPENAGSRRGAWHPPHDSPVMAVAHAGARSVVKSREAAKIGAGATNAKLQGMTRTSVGLSALLIAFSGFAYACGAGDLSSFGADSAKPAETGGDAGAGATGVLSPEPSDARGGPVDNAVILVHAAKSNAFRLCFENELDRRPQPDSQVMPEANVVGVEVGTAVRLPPLRGAPGKVTLFDEALIRGLYPTFGGSNAGLSCKDLIANAPAIALELGTIDTDLSHGVHLLVVTGCPADPASPTVHKYSVAECGNDWTPKGNRSVKEITLAGATRTNGLLPAQVVNLSQPLQSAAAGRDLVVTFGDVTQASSTHVPVATNPLLFGGAAPTQPAQLTYPADDTAIYETLGFRVTLGPSGGTGDAAAQTKVLDASLARIQKASSPRDVPPTYYATASNYALLLLGDPAPQLADGTPDTDERRMLHLLAVPVVEPKGDAGDEGGTTEPIDGGAATTP